MCFTMVIVYDRYLIRGCRNARKYKINNLHVLITIPLGPFKTNVF